MWRALRGHITRDASPCFMLRLGLLPERGTVAARRLMAQIAPLPRCKALKCSFAGGVGAEGRIGGERLPNP